MYCPSVLIMCLTQTKCSMSITYVLSIGGATPPGVFWPDDPASRQLAAQFLQTNPMTPTSWYGSGAFQFQQNATAASPGVTQGSQMPFTVPAGYKLAQDSVTGQILFLPAGMYFVYSYSIARVCFHKRSKLCHRSD